MIVAIIASQWHYYVGYTNFLSNTEVKQHFAWAVLGWETAGAGEMGLILMLLRGKWVVPNLGSPHRQTSPSSATNTREAKEIDRLAIKGQVNLLHKLYCFKPLLVP